MRGILLAIPVVAILVAGCGDSPEVSAGEANEVPAPPEVTAVQAALVYDVICGCKLPDIGSCGNYLKHGDEYLEITGDVGLGVMAFCEMEDAQGKVAGQVVDGKFAATSFELVHKE